MGILSLKSENVLPLGPENVLPLRQENVLPLTQFQGKQFHHKVHICKLRRLRMNINNIGDDKKEVLRTKSILTNQLRQHSV